MFVLLNLAFASFSFIYSRVLCLIEFNSQINVNLEHQLPPGQGGITLKIRANYKKIR